jgi:hypothetical protein
MARTPQISTLRTKRPTRSSASTILADIDRINRARYDVRRAQLILTLAEEPTVIEDRERQGMLIGTASDALDPVLVELTEATHSLSARLQSARSSRPRKRSASR